MNRYIKFYFLFLGVLFSQLCLAQRQDTTYQVHFAVGKTAILDIDFNHADIMISASEDDSLHIFSSLSLIPANPTTPFNGIETNSIQKDSNLVKVTLKVGQEIQPSNELKAFCRISLPRNRNLKLNSRYGTIDISGFSGQLEGHLEYSTLNSLSLDAKHNHNITGNYSEVYIDSIRGVIKTSGTNLKITSKYIQHIECKSQFSTFTANEIAYLKSNSYTDKFIIKKADTIYIDGDYSSLMIDQLTIFFQSELSYGAIIIKKTSPRFKTINMAHEYVSTQLHLPKSSSYSFNADMRYSELKADIDKLKSVASPGGNLYNGIIGNKKLTRSKVSIISKFGDVSISKD